MAGSLRRQADSVKDLDIIATAKDPAALAAALGELPLVESVLHARGRRRRARDDAHAGIKVDLKVVEPDQFGNVLQHFTGSKAHNVALRESAVRRGLHVSEYGILDDATGETLRCATEEEVYETLGLAWIPPELREGRGELEAALPAGRAAGADHADDMRGDLHCHTTLCDGRQTLEQMVEAARGRGLEYLAITDHSASHGFGDHVTPEALAERIEAIRALNASLDDFEVLAGTEVNILPDGGLDYDDELLAKLDWVIASVHTSFSMSERGDDRPHDRARSSTRGSTPSATRRAARSRRAPPYALDVERVIEAAARTGTMLEINSAPDRRDLNELHARAAAEAGVRRADRHRRALGAELRAAAVRDRDRAAGVADAGAGAEHAPVGGVRAAAEAQATRRSGLSPGSPGGARRAARSASPPRAAPARSRARGPRARPARRSGRCRCAARARSGAGGSA